MGKTNFLGKAYMTSTSVYISSISRSYRFRSCLNVFILKCPPKGKSCFKTKYKQDLYRFKRYKQMWAEMFMPISANIFAVYLIRYGSICKNWNSQGFRLCLLVFYSKQAHIKRPVSANNASESCIFMPSISMHICIYDTISVPICVYQTALKFMINWTTDWRVHQVQRFCLYWIAHCKGQ